MKKTVIYIITLILIIGVQEVKADDRKILTLDDCIKLTLQSNPQLKSSEMNIMSSEGNYGIARSNMLPQVNAVADWQRATANLAATSKSPYISNFIVPPGNTNYPYYSASIGLNQQIFTFGKNYFGMRSASELVKSSKYNFINTRNTLIYDVKQNFFNLLQYNMIIDTDEYLIKQVETQLKQAEVYYKAGIDTKIDVLSAKASLGNIRLNLITAENARQIYILNLLSLMNMPLTDDVEFKGALVAAPFSSDINAATEQALNIRPDYLALKKQLDAATYSYKQSYSAFFPSLTGNASYNWAGQAFPIVWNWQVGLELTFNIFSGLQNSSALEVARAGMLQLKYNLDQLKLSVGLQVASAIDTIQQAEKSISVAGDTVKQSEANLALVAKGYKAGVNNYLDYLTAVSTYQNAKSSYASALANYNIAIANLDYVIGKGLTNE